MIVAQHGIFAQGTRAHYLLEFEVLPGTSDDDVRNALKCLREPAVTAGGLNIVIGFGPDLLRRLVPADTLDTFHPFTEIDGPGGHLPSTQRDIWIWLHGTGHDIVLDAARFISAALKPVARLALEQPCFVYHDSRDTTGFIDGTANPPVAEANDVAVIPDGETGAGGSFVIAIRWVHDLEKFHAQPQSHQERVFGRTKPDSIEMSEDVKPANAHIARVEVDGDKGEELEIFRRSVPYGTVSEIGLYFIGFSADIARFDIMLSRMFGTSGDGLSDHLMDFTTPVSGSFFFAPSVEALATIC